MVKVLRPQPARRDRPSGTDGALRVQAVPAGPTRCARRSALALQVIISITYRGGLSITAC